MPRIWVDFEQIQEDFEQIQEDLEQIQEDFEQIQEDFVQVFLNLLKVFLNLLQVFLNLLQDFDLTFSFRAMGQDLGEISVRLGKLNVRCLLACLEDSVELSLECIVESRMWLKHSKYCALLTRVSFRGCTWEEQNSRYFERAFTHMGTPFSTPGTQIWECDCINVLLIPQGGVVGKWGWGLA